MTTESHVCNINKYTIGWPLSEINPLALPKTINFQRVQVRCWRETGELIDAWNDLTLKLHYQVSILLLIVATGTPTLGRVRIEKKSLRAAYVSIYLPPSRETKGEKNT